MKPSCSRKDLSEGFPVTTTVPSILISTLELICEGISDGPPANYEPQLEIPGEDDGLGEDAMDIDMWERQGERDKNLTLQEVDLDSCTLPIAQALLIFASLPGRLPIIFGGASSTPRTSASYSLRFSHCRRVVCPT
ncbi:hypothetical protein ARMSODRAFT_1014430 [Armillaria solidipes]|uniref:Uncharacterized protein n=1 Tax=Armillaria solidipes TaxID=1076256 RepID=A0A2H3CDA8_9AGAR|nr:hypothetical protein ARMSODRAFT_1014430 [Armillaria solidipes]